MEIKKVPTINSGQCDPTYIKTHTGHRDVPVVTEGVSTVGSEVFPLHQHRSHEDRAPSSRAVRYEAPW